MGDRLCPFSVEEAKSLTVPKLKAELIRLNQPVAGLKRKAHFVDALIAIIEGHAPTDQAPAPEIAAVDTAEARVEAKEISSVDTAEPKAKEDSILPVPDIAETEGEQGSNLPDADTAANTPANAASASAGAESQPEHPDESETSQGAGESAGVVAPTTGFTGDDEGSETDDMQEAGWAGDEPERAPDPDDNAGADVRAPQVKPSAAPPQEGENAAREMETDDDKPMQKGGQVDVAAKTPAEALSGEVKKLVDEDMDAKRCQKQRESEAMDVADGNGGAPDTPSKAASATPPSSRKSRRRSGRVDGVLHDQARSGKKGDGGDGDGDGDRTSGAGAAADEGTSDAGTPSQEPRSKRSRRSSSSKKSKKSSEAQQELAVGDVSATATETTGISGSGAKPERKPDDEGEMDETRGVTTGKVAAAEDPTDGNGVEAAPVPEPPAAIANEEEGNSGSKAKKGEEGKVKTEGAPALVTIRVDNFVRPFTAQQAKKLLEDKAGAPLVEGGFWMDSIKTHCYATVEGQEAADRAIAALQGLQWPPQSFKRLEAKIGDVSAEEAKTRDDAKRANRPGTSTRPRLKLGPRQTSANSVEAAAGHLGTGRAGANGTSHGADPEVGVVRGRGSVQAPGVAGVKRGTWGANGFTGAAMMEQAEEQEDGPIKLDEIFRKTTAKPALYWLPLSEEEVGERKRKMKQDGVGPRTTAMPADHVESASGGARGTGANSGGGWGGGGSRRGYGGGGSSAYRPDYSYGGGGGRRR